MKKMICLFVMLLSLMMFAQTNIMRLPSGGNKRSKMLSSAQKMEIQGQFDIAEEIYRNMLNDYPNDLMVITRLFNILMRTSRLDQAEELLNKYKNVFSSEKRTEMEVRVNLQKGNLVEAESMALKELKKSNYKLSLVNALGSLFSAYRDDEFAIDMYEKARSMNKNPNLYIIQLATAYQNANKPEKAVKEVLRYASNKNQRYTMLRTLRSILDSDITHMRIIEKEVRKLKTEISADLLTDLYNHVHDYESALNEVKKLSEDKIDNFIRQQMQLKNWDVARKGYAHLLDSTSGFVERAEIRLDIARVDVSRGEYFTAYEDMKLLYNDLQKKSYRTRRKNLKFESAVILAELERNLNHDFDKMLEYLNFAKKSTNNVFQKNQVVMELMKHYLINGSQEDYKKQKKQLRLHASNTSQVIELNFLEIQKNLLEDKVEKADTLLADVIITYPSGEEVNNVLMLSNAVRNIKSAEKKKFWEVYSLYNNAYPDSAVSECIRVYKDKGDDVFLLYGLYWAFDSGQSEKINEIRDFEIKNEILSGYVQVLLNHFRSEVPSNQDFIKEQAGSEFSPLLRYYVLKGQVNNH